MITLIGAYTSPFTRIVGTALHAVGLRFEHLPLAPVVPAEAEHIKTWNPLGRIPAMVCPDGLVLWESSVILDWIDHEVGPARALLPSETKARLLARKLEALATGTLDRFVALLYEGWRPQERQWDQWIGQQETGAVEGLLALDAAWSDRDIDIASPDRPFIATMIAMAYGSFLRPQLMQRLSLPRLQPWYDMCHKLPPFKHTEPGR